MFHQVSQGKNPDLEGGLMGLGTTIIRVCNITFTCGGKSSQIQREGNDRDVNLSAQESPVQSRRRQ